MNTSIGVGACGRINGGGIRGERKSAHDPAERRPGVARRRYELASSAPSPNVGFFATSPDPFSSPVLNQRDIGVLDLPFRALIFIAPFRRTEHNR